MEIMFRVPEIVQDFSGVEATELVMRPEGSNGIQHIGDGGSRPPAYEVWSVKRPGFIAGCRRNMETESLAR